LTLAETAVDDTERRRSAQMARLLERQIQMARTFPISLWLFCAGILVPLGVWAVLKVHGHSRAGVAVGLAVAAAEAWRWHRNRVSSK
jgi:hypothetical protein